MTLNQKQLKSVIEDVESLSFCQDAPQKVQEMKEKLFWLTSRCERLFKGEEKKERIPFGEKSKFDSLRATLEAVGGVKLKCGKDGEEYVLKTPYNSFEVSFSRSSLIFEFYVRKKKVEQGSIQEGRQTVPHSGPERTGGEG